MKRNIAILLTMLFLLGMIPSAFADFSSFSFSTSSEEGGSESAVLSKLEYDPEGELYPFTGTGDNVRGHTVMLYLCGSNLESGGGGMRGGSATSDLKEIIGSGYDQDKVSVLVMAGGSKKWFNQAIETDDTGIYEVVDSSLVKRNSEGIMDMDQADTLSYFVNYCYKNYPAEEYSLIIWDHGGGPLGGLLHDGVSGKSMTSVLRVCDALKKTPAAKDKLYLLGFDACLEGSVEIARLMSPYAKQMVASEEPEPGYGWNYYFLKGLEKDADPAMTGSRIVETYFEQYSESWDDKITLSSIDLTKVDELVEKSEKFFGELSRQMETLGYLQFASVRAKLEPVNMSSPKLDLVDLEETVRAFSQFAPKEAQELLKAIETTICSERHNKGVSSGLSIYFPYNDYKNYAKSGSSKYTLLGYDEGFSSFIQSFNKLQRQPQATDWTLGDEAYRDTRTIFNLLLTSDQVQNLADASLVILWKQDDANGSSYIAVNPEGKAELVEEQLFGDYVHSAMYAVSDDGNRLNEWPLVWERDVNGNYLVNCIFNSGESSIDAQLVCSLDEGTDILNVVSVSVREEGEDYYSPRIELNYDEIDTVTFMVPSYRITTDENGLMRGVFDWELADEASYVLDFHGDWNLKMILDSIDSDELYAAFVLTDYYLDTHTSTLVPVGNPDSNDDGYDRFVLTYDDDFIELTDVVSTNNNDVYVYFTAYNPNEQEIFVHIDQVYLNGKPIEAELWIEGNGQNDGIPSKTASSDTLVLSGMASAELTDLQTISLIITVVDAQTEEEIATIDGTGYLSLNK